MKSLFLLALLIASPTYALDCETAKTDLDIAQCELRALEKEDAAVATELQRVQAIFLQPDVREEDRLDALKAIEAAQNAWEAFREVDCQAVYAMNATGTIRHPAYAMCLRFHSKQRLMQLKELSERGSY